LEHIFFRMLLKHILFFFNDRSLLSQDYKKKNLFGPWSIYFWWMDGMFCVIPGVGVSSCQGVRPGRCARRLPKQL
jgi:hypothetical protein